MILRSNGCSSYFHTVSAFYISTNRCNYVTKHRAEKIRRTGEVVNDRSLLYCYEGKVSKFGLFTS